MTRSEEIKSLQKVIKDQDTLIQELRADKKKIRDERDYLFNTAKSLRDTTEDNRALERTCDSLRAIIASANKGFGLHITKTA